MIAAGPARAQDALTLVHAQPTGALSSLEQAAEIRIRFSEPMVAIGRPPDQVTAPFVAIRPALAGTFRWAGPTLLVFTPDPGRPLPTATRYDVTVAAAATAVSGRTRARAYSFTFTTPTVRLLAVNWYRLDGRYDRPAILALRFNQAVRPADALAHVTARYQVHEWQRPIVNAAARARMGAEPAARFDANVSVTDSRDKVIDRRTVTMNGWSSLEWTLKLPADGALGNYQVGRAAGDASLAWPLVSPRHVVSARDHEGRQADAAFVVR